MAKEECQMCHTMVRNPLHSKDEIHICYDCAKIIASNANISMTKFSAYLWTFEELTQMYNQGEKAKELIVGNDERRADLAGRLKEQLEIIEVADVKFSNYHKSITLPNTKLFSLSAYDTYSYNDITKFEYYEDSNLITEGGVGKAIVGGMLFGSVGAIIGSNGTKTTKKYVDKQEVHISIRKPGTYDIIIYKIDVAHAFKYSMEKAEKLMLLLQEAIDMVKPQEMPQHNDTVPLTENQIDIPLQIRKYKELMDDGIISVEEFETKKGQLLKRDF